MLLQMLQSPTKTDLYRSSAGDVGELAWGESTVGDNYPQAIKQGNIYRRIAE